jgi:hypothetical protein
VVSNSLVDVLSPMWMTHRLPPHDLTMVSEPMVRWRIQSASCIESLFDKDIQTVYLILSSMWIIPRDYPLSPNTNQPQSTHCNFLLATVVNTMLMLIKNQIIKYFIKIIIFHKLLFLKNYILVKIN